MSIDWSDLLSALGLLLVFEGLMPFLSPSSFKRNLIRILAFPESVLRIVGMGLIIVGIILLLLIR